MHHGYGPLVDGEASIGDTSPPGRVRMSLARLLVTLIVKYLEAFGVTGVTLQDIHRFNSVIDSFVHYCNIHHFFAIVLPLFSICQQTQQNMAPALVHSSRDKDSSITTTSKFPQEASSEAYAQSLDAQCPLRSFRDQYIFPTKASLKSTTLTTPDSSTSDEAIYFCGNSLGLQPKRTAQYIQAHLSTWAGIGVHGHFTQLFDSPLRPWQDLAAQAAEQSAPIVGALASEVAIMNSLTANLHLAMAAFYKPEGRRRKILLEWKAFPSDHYTIESQVRWHGYEPEDAMILLEPDQDHIISTEKILRVIEEQADEIALVMLPGIQYYSGQLFDIERITAFAHEKGLKIGWDLAHAAGNVPVKLHDWDVDFAVWCTYKYMNGGPGSMGGFFLHERHGKVEVDEASGKPVFMPRLMGWYGGDKSSRFKMDNKFMPIVGAGGFQLSNPSAIDLASLNASLSLFSESSIEALREKSLKMTAYLQYLLLKDTSSEDEERLFRIITPLDPKQRGAQLSLLLKPGYLKSVADKLKEAGIVADQREPGVIRVAPVPMYNTYSDVWRFVVQFKKALGIWTED